MVTGPIDSKEKISELKEKCVGVRPIWPLFP
jgi:hypothetical protein